MAINTFADLIRRRPNAPRWPYVIPVVVGMLFVGHAIEDAGPGGAAILGIPLLLCALQAIWPTVLGWVLLFGPFLAYGIVVAASPGAGPFDEWIIFMLLGLGPALLLWLGRPWRDRRTAKSGGVIEAAQQGDEADKA